ncbi:General secretion pathway protein G [Candidatus Saccharibacteria bacterium RAAC3_TM7_1]|nr:General secretion pathway protein G [Candidatus Saccharibacteria bacterium RAAC3_TM7_1]HCZ28759.1 prepilin-type N-terminal cleavage/methylation domain-containing protein [Candidatus Saccharibacteria bacterium]
MKLWARQTGFTIVELLIVIVVIAILAAITIVAYNSIQARARDNVRKQDLAQISKALKLYAVDNDGDYASLQCGSGGTNSYGWLPSDYDGAGSLKSINACLTEGGYLSKALVDPGGLGACTGLTCFAYMKASCASGTYLYAHLETLPQAATDLDGTCQSGWDTAYGMNYALRVN